MARWCAALALISLGGCEGSGAAPDAADYQERCVPTAEPFGVLTGRLAIRSTLNVHVDAAGLIETDTTTHMLLAVDLTQDGTKLAVAAQVCQIEIPGVPLAGQELPIQFEIPEAAITSIGIVTADATLSSPDQSCASFSSAPITMVVGARIDPAVISTAPLPSVDDMGMYSACSPSAATPCAEATGSSCACDQEGDAKPGVTVIAHNVPALELDEVYVTLRTTFNLTGQVWSADSIKGTIDASLETGIVGCLLEDNVACTVQNLRLVRALNPVITQQAGNPSRFRTARVEPAATCADIIANQAVLFPR
ncbi:MAG: hypothetical protein AB7O24_26580 [Kofleriaceae bacterium]